MFTTPKFNIGETVFAKDTRIVGPLTALSFNPKEKGYIITVKDGNNNIFTIDEENLVAEDKAFFLVQCEYVWDCDRTDINAIFTNNYTQAKEVFDAKVKESKDTIKERELEWSIDEDGHTYSAYDEGYYPTDHEDITLQVFEVGDTEC